jgi:hypothetical protein
MELERASDRWHTLHGLHTEPMPTVSSYVGYSPEQQRGQPRVLFGIEARQAEQLAALLDRHDCTGPMEPVPREPASEPAPPPLRRAKTRGRHAAGGPAAAAARGPGARGYAWQTYGAAAQALAEPQDYTGPQGYPLQRPGRLYAVPSEPDSDLGAWQAQAAQYSQAQDYARFLREAAEKEATAIRQQAAAEAASLTREASEEAARIREAAEKEAAELRAALAAMSGEMGRVAAYVTETLTVPDIPAIRPAQTPVTRPFTLRPLPPAPPARPARAPATRPERLAPRPARPATKPAAPGKEPAKRTRQEKAFRVARFGVAAGLVTVAAIGTTEFAVHGGSPFFLFRQGGAGETPGNSTDQQFLARQEAKPLKPKAKVVRPAAKRAEPKPAPKASH